MRCRVWRVERDRRAFGRHMGAIPCLHPEESRTPARGVSPVTTCSVTVALFLPAPAPCGPLRCRARSPSSTPPRIGLTSATARPTRDRSAVCDRTHDSSGEVWRLRSTDVPAVAAAYGLRTMANASPAARSPAAPPSSPAPPAGSVPPWPGGWPPTAPPCWPSTATTTGVKALARDVAGIEPVVCDLSDLDAVDALPAEVDVLVNNAGLQHVAPVHEFDPERFSPDPHDHAGGAVPAGPADRCRTCTTAAGAGSSTSRACTACGRARSSRPTSRPSTASRGCRR